MHTEPQVPVPSRTKARFYDVLAHHRGELLPGESAVLDTVYLAGLTGQTVAYSKLREAEDTYLVATDRLYRVAEREAEKMPALKEHVDRAWILDLDAWITRRKRYSIIFDPSGEERFRSREAHEVLDWAIAEGVQELRCETPNQVVLITLQAAGPHKEQA